MDGEVMRVVNATVILDLAAPNFFFNTTTRRRNAPSTRPTIGLECQCNSGGFAQYHPLNAAIDGQKIGNPTGSVKGVAACAIVAQKAAVSPVELGIGHSLGGAQQGADLVFDGFHK
jgi:hypothetical protein